jgi:hypothetical protein
MIPSTCCATTWSKKRGTVSLEKTMLASRHCAITVLPIRSALFWLESVKKKKRTEENSSADNGDFRSIVCSKIGTKRWFSLNFIGLAPDRSRCGSAVKWWKWENKLYQEDPRSPPPPRATSFFKKRIGPWSLWGRFIGANGIKLTWLGLHFGPFFLRHIRSLCHLTRLGSRSGTTLFCWSPTLKISKYQNSNCLHQNVEYSLT